MHTTNSQTYSINQETAANDLSTKSHTNVQFKFRNASNFAFDGPKMQPTPSNDLRSPDLQKILRFVNTNDSLFQSSQEREFGGNLNQPSIDQQIKSE